MWQGRLAEASGGRWNGRLGEGDPTFPKSAATMSYRVCRLSVAKGLKSRRVATRLLAMLSDRTYMREPDRGGWSMTTILLVTLVVC